MAEPGRASRLGRLLGDLGGFDPLEQLDLIVHLLRWIVLGSVVGVLAGLSSAGFLVT